jgi:hypothetical protein
MIGNVHKYKNEKIIANKLIKKQAKKTKDNKNSS